MPARLEASGQLVVPTQVRRRAGIKPGDRIEFEAARGVITIRKSGTEAADQEYTPAQRRIIQARIKKADADVAAGRVYGPFRTHEELMASLASKRNKANLQSSKRTKRR